MFQGFKNFVLREPARFYLIVRTLLYFAVSYVAVLQNIDLEPVLGILALVLGIDAVSSEKGIRDQVYQPTTVTGLVKEASFLPGVGSIWVTEVGKFVFNLIKSRVDETKVPQAMAVLTPMLSELASAALTPELRGELQVKVHSFLHNANLISKTTIPARAGALGIVFLLFTLSACGPVTQAVSENTNALVSDGASLSYTADGALFAPGASDALIVSATVKGESLAYYEKADNCKPVEDYLLCTQTVVTPAKPWTIDLSGVDMSVTVSFQRASGSKHLVLP